MEYVKSTGKGIPDVDNLKVISKVLNVSIDFLLDDEEVLDKTVIKEQINLDDYVKEGQLRSKKDTVGELVRLNIDDIDFSERGCVVYGKGDKERKAYFDAKSKIHLLNYIESRTDNNIALFVSLNKPHSRLTDTTLRYAMVNQNNVKLSHRKYIS